MEWYYAKHGKQEGPVDLATLQGKLQSGELSPTDLIWREGMADWIAASGVAEVMAAPAPVVPAGGLQLGGGAAPYAYPMNAPVAHAPIPNYLVQSILVTIFCCWPFGIPAIIFAAKVDGLVSRGEIARAQDASRQAKMWCWISFGIGLTVILAYGVLVAFAGFNA